MNLYNYLRKKARVYILFLFDFVSFSLVNFAYFLFSPITIDQEFLFLNSVILITTLIVLRIAVGVYHTVWRYTSTRAYLKLFSCDMSALVLSLIITYAFDICHSIWHIMSVTTITTTIAVYSRLCYRMLYKYINKRDDTRIRANTAIVGAGQLGICLANDLRTNPNSSFEPKFFIDADNSKVENTVAGLKVHSHIDAKEYIKSNNISDVIIAISKIDSAQLSEMFQFYTELGCNVKIFDTLVDTNKSYDLQTSIHDICIDDLLFRNPIELDNDNAYDFYANKTVIVTGGGGSIGSELCRQIAKFNTRKLIIIDNYENNAYDIQQELLMEHGHNLDLSVEIVSVQDENSLDKVFCKYRPDIVFHAAAHKHVPFMEDCGYQAIKNNVFGTYNVVNAAEKYNVQKFVLISTDKAVNPTNIMGATKRICEMIVQSRGDSNTNFAAVRFGNVLGSNGSVIPLFKKQIAAGGPITITDKRIIRYFMTIPEASSLVIRAGTMAKRGELFVLDMGKPTKIYDLAKNMIKLSGLRPDVDIKIEEIGLRPGEKLYEELLIRTEEMDTTDNDKIFVERDTPLTREEIEDMICSLKECCETEGEDVRSILKKFVPTFYDAQVLNNDKTNSQIIQTL